MNRTIRAALAFAFVVAGAAMATAQESSFPAVCRTDVKAAPGHSSETMQGITQQHQKDSMASMMTMDRDMMQGMMKDDADVAFICGMIAHHQGAIDMAKVELTHGDDAWAKKFAQRVIDAQTREIAEMTEWLKTNAK